MFDAIRRGYGVDADVSPISPDENGLRVSPSVPAGGMVTHEYRTEGNLHDFINGKPITITITEVEARGASTPLGFELRTPKAYIPGV